MMLEQQAMLENMPVKEGFGYDHPALPVPNATASSSKAKASSPVRGDGQGCQVVEETKDAGVHGLGRGIELVSLCETSSVSF